MANKTQLAQKNTKQSLLENLADTIGNISAFVVISFSLIVLTSSYVASDLPKGIFIGFWILGVIVIIMKTLTTNFLSWWGK